MQHMFYSDEGIERERKLKDSEQQFANCFLFSYRNTATLDDCQADTMPQYRAQHTVTVRVTQLTRNRMQYIIVKIEFVTQK